MVLKGFNRAEQNKLKLMRRLSFAKTYRKLFWRAAFVQFLLFLVASFCLDRGEMLWIFLYSSLAFWTTALVVVLRRPENPARWDVFYFNYGLVIISLLNLLVFPVAWWLRGI